MHGLYISGLVMIFGASGCEPPLNPVHFTALVVKSIGYNLAPLFTFREQPVLLIGSIFTSSFDFFYLAMPTCVKPLPLGLENREIENSQMAASNALKSTNNTASEARINVGNGWCTKNVNSPYIIIDLGSMVTVTSITTQGGMVQNKTYFTSKYAVQFGYTNSAWYSYFEMNESKVSCLLYEYCD